LIELVACRLRELAGKVEQCRSGPPDLQPDFAERTAPAGS
jgi:hypothetical protein